MRLVALLVLALSCSAQFGGMFPGPGTVHTAGGSPPSIINSISKGGIGGGTTTQIDTSGATMLLVIVADDSPTSAIADTRTGCPSPCNAWHHLTVYSATSSSSIWYAFDKFGGGSALVTGTQHTVTLSTGDAPFFIFAAANNTSTSPTDPYTGVQNGPGTSTGTTIQTGSVAPTGTSLIITGLGAYTNLGTFSISPAGFTIIAQSPLVAGSNYAGAAAYAVTGSASNPIWTLNNGLGSSLTSSIAVFK